MADNDKRNTPRGMFDETPREEEPKKFAGMFEEDRAAHGMTKKKERIIIVVVIIVALIATVVIACLTFKWRHDAFARRYLAAPQYAWSTVSTAAMPQTESL